MNSCSLGVIELIGVSFTPRPDLPPGIESSFTYFQFNIQLGPGTLKGIHVG